MLSKEAEIYFSQIKPKEAGGLMRLLKNLIEYNTETDDPWVWTQMLDNAEMQVAELMDFLSLSQEVADDEKEDNE